MRSENPPPETIIVPAAVDELRRAGGGGKEAEEGFELVTGERVADESQMLVSEEVEESGAGEGSEVAAGRLPPPVKIGGVRPAVSHTVLAGLDGFARTAVVLWRAKIGDPLPVGEIASPAGGGLRLACDRLGNWFTRQTVERGR